MNDAEIAHLAARAVEARRWAYAPYSRYRVGAALLAASGITYDGCNVENAAYPVTMCAERVAVFKAISEGERQFIAIAIATENGGSPCGSCRQVLAEFAPDLIVLLVNGRGEVTKQTTLRELLPDAFGPAQLQTNDVDES
ncbi:MAG: cytidine deaminase [Anaerolineales bacterium]|nr:cytidine deaminase [Anaerolineales bacterium]